MPKAILFDIDDTLTQSFKPLAPLMVERLNELLEFVPVGIVSGRQMKQLGKEFLETFASSAHASQFLLVLNGGAHAYQCDHGEWKTAYDFAFSKDEMETVASAAKETVIESNALDGLPVFGERYVDKDSMFTLASLGIHVPDELRYTWDPENKRRATLQKALASKLPTYDVVMGGATAVDVTKKGINKAFGVRWIAQQFKVEPSEMMYFGDALYPGGNDYVVVETGIQAVPVKDPTQTGILIDELLKKFKLNRK